REMALVAIHETREAQPDGSVSVSQRIVGVSRYVTNVDGTTCEFALAVADDFGGKGLGSRLMLSIMEAAREKGLAEIEGLVLVNNPGMLRLMKSLGFTIKPYAEDADFRLVTHAL
ncbi:MAG: GNAT family N-acetyltransferase, partial [Burkholderiaceae bacterium]|nr:GNAT family N-acetyltransferase [Burkholderiaceae bacterium]